MKDKAPQQRNISTAKIVAIYALFGLSWIYGSDTVLGWMVHDPAVMVKIAVIKGSLFIACTATLLFILISRFARKLASAESSQIESLKNYVSIFNATNEAIFIHDAQTGHVLDVNDRMPEIFGYSREEALCLDIGQLSAGTPPYSQQEAVEKVFKAVSEGPQVFEWLSRKKSGELFWSEVSLTRVTTNGYDRIIAVSRDISERKLLEETQRKNEETHRLIVNSALDGFWLVTPEGNLLEVNDAYCRMSGYSMQELLTMCVMDLDVHESGDDVLAHSKKIKNQGRDRFVAKHRRKDGSVFDVEVSAMYIPVDGGLHVGFLRDVTASKKAEDDLRSSEEKFSAIFRMSPDSININRLEDGVFVDVNEGFTSLLGYLPDEVVGKSSTAVGIWVNPEDRARLAEQLKAIGFIKNLETQLCHKDGSLLTALISSRLIELNGELCTLNIARDISERKQVEDAVLKERNRAQGYLDTVEALIVALNAEGIIVTINRKACQILGYPEAELLGKNWFATCIPQPEGEDKNHHFFQKIMAGNPEAKEYFESPVVTRGGELRHIAWHNALLRDELGQINGMLSAGEDITERKTAENALRESNNKILGLVNSVPGHVAFVNADTLVYEFVNKAFETSFGMPREKIIGSYVKDIIGEENLNFALKYIETAKSGKPVTYENTFNLTSGKRWIQVNYNPIADADGHVVSLVVLSFDITHLKELELERLKVEKLESLGVLAGGIAHDFNNVLTGIMGNISLAKRFIDASHKSYNALEGAEKASVRATDLARQLLTFARGGEPVKKVVSVQNIVNESVSLVLHGSNVKSDVDIPDSVHAVEADEGQLSQVLHNIIINATQAMPGGGILTVMAYNEMLEDNNSSSLSPGKYVRLSLTDEGCGISDAVMKKIFDPYFTTKASGSGLGLASVHSIIAKHKGHIGVSSIVGKGTTFTIHLPSMGETYSEYTAEVATPDTSEPKGCSVLVMDDEEIILDLTAAMLQEIGFQAEVCNNGKDAAECYKVAKESGTPFSAVIMDLTIPGGMGGKEAAETILAFDPTACLIVSSGYSNDPIMANFERYGFKGAIAKPYRLNELINILRQSIPTSKSSLFSG